MGEWLHWSVFFIVLGALLVLDLAIFHRKTGKESMRASLLWSGFWIALSLLFNGWIYVSKGPEPALQFFTGYLLEKALSVDNLFVFCVIFSAFKVPGKIHHKVLYFGILGALVFRIVLILAGISLITMFHWILYVLGGFLAITGIRLLLQNHDEKDPQEHIVVRLFRRFFPVTKDYHGDKFFIVRAGKLLATPLFVVLLVIESTDVIFALDSIPAIFAITLDPFIIFTSNVFAILGLRSLYFVLAHALDRFAVFKIGISMILIFIGCKMVIAPFYAIPLFLSLAVILAILLVCTLIALKKRS
jgi:tellurite resistance protein TerC